MSTIVPVLATDQIFPQANIVAGVLVLVMGFGLHFLGELYSALLVPGQPHHRSSTIAVTSSQIVVP